jgi:hypothetical protein
MLPQWIDMPEDVDEEMTRFLVAWGEKHRSLIDAKNARRRARYAQKQEQKKAAGTTPVPAAEKKPPTN